LKDAQIEASEYPILYEELVLNIRRMYHQCKLVHADLSEYNILYHDSHLYIIDVSQSVEHDHPSAFDFLRNDLKNVEEFFGRFGVKCLGLRRCFEFVTKENLSDSGEENGTVLKRWLGQEAQPEEDAETASDGSGDASHQAAAVSAHEDSVFRQSYIPRSLNEVYDPERDVEALKKGEGRGLIYADTIGLVDPSKKEDSTAKVRFEGDNKEDTGDSDDTESEESREDNGSGSGSDTDGKRIFEGRTLRGHRHEDREAKKVCSLIQIKADSTLKLACLGTEKSSQRGCEREAKTQDTKSR
jgi:RIO kinase 1